MYFYKETNIFIQQGGIKCREGNVFHKHFLPAISIRVHISSVKESNQ